MLSSSPSRNVCDCFHLFFVCVFSSSIKRRHCNHQPKSVSKFFDSSVCFFLFFCPLSLIFVCVFLEHSRCIFFVCLVVYCAVIRVCVRGSDDGRRLRYKRYDEKGKPSHLWGKGLSMGLPFVCLFFYSFLTLLSKSHNIIIIII